MKDKSRKPTRKVGQLRLKNKVPVIEPSKLQTVDGLLGTAHKYIPFGSDNLFPSAIAQLCRQSPVHRGILNRKTEFIAGADWTTENEQLNELFKNINTDGEDFTDVFKKFTFDKLSGGNGWLEFVTNTKRNFLNIFHHDWTTCRLSKDKANCLVTKNWRSVNAKPTEIPIYPKVKRDGSLIRTMIHVKDYEPEFENYGVMAWIAGLNVVAIGYKTDRWNVNRLDNAFQPSGVFVLSGSFKSDEEAEETVQDLEDEFSGEEGQGKVIFIAQDADGKESKFIPLELKFDGDWSKLDENAITKLIAAHSWYRSLTSLPDSNGFDTERILNEWRIANKTTIVPEQRTLLRPIKRVIEDLVGIDTSDLAFINTPPVKEEKPKYMRVWEARRADGLDYDPEDATQQVFLANL